MPLQHITNAEVIAAGVVSAPNVLNGTPQQNKAVFDKLIAQIVAPAYNACVDAVNALDDMESGMEAAEEARQEAEEARSLWEDYDGEKTYVPGNKVAYNGSSYVNIAACTGIAPTAAAYWLLIAQKGDTGPQGIQGLQGTQGETGADGKSAYASAQDGGYTGTEEQFNTDLAAVGDKYELPEGGIPKNDLDPSVQASLDTEIFEIVYGETKVSDIAQAINAGKLPVCFTTEGPEGLVDLPASKYAYVYTNYGARYDWHSGEAEVETIYLRGRRGKGRHGERKMRIEKTSVFNPDTRRSEESAVYSISLVPTIPSGTRHLYANAQQGLFSTEDALDEASTFYNEEGNVTTPQVNDVTYVWFSDKLYVITQIIEGVITWGAVKTFSEVPIASEETLGGIKAGSDFDIAEDGTLSLYKALTMSASVSPSSAEMGSTIDEVTVSWTLNKTPVSQSVEDVDVPVSARSKALTDLGITTNRTFNVTAADGRMSLTRNPGITFYRYVYSKVGSPDSAPTQASECAKQSDLSTFGDNGATFNYTAGDTLWLLTTKANAQIQTNVLGQWADVTTIYAGTVEFTQANGAVATYHAYNTGAFSGTGSAKYRIR